MTQKRQTHPELDALPAMVPDDGTQQRPLTVTQLLQGERRGVDKAWAQGHEAAAMVADDPLPSPPAITSLAELEALAEQPLFDEEHDNERIEAEPDASDAPVANFGGPAIRCEPKLPTLNRTELTERITHDVLDRLTGLGDHRLSWPLADKPETERRVLTQIDALVCLGSEAFSVVEAAPATSPWSSWAIVFALACVEGRQAVASVYDHVAQLGPEQRQHRRRAAEAFAASHNPHAVPLARACLATPGAEPFGLELLSLLHQLRPEDLAGWLKQPDPETRAVALRAWTRLGTPPSDLRALQALLDTPDADLAWQAARALTFWGSGAPLAALRHGETLVQILGERAIELVVLTGHHDDAPLVQRLVRRLEPTAELLDAVARLGHPGTWAFLAHFLGDAVLADDAVSALKTAFGDRVDDDHRLDAERWEAAIAALGLEEHQRVRQGQPWSPNVVAAECADPNLTADQIAQRLDELRARCRVHLSVPFWDFTPRHETFVTDLDAALRRTGALR